MDLFPLSKDEKVARWELETGERLRRDVLLLLLRLDEYPKYPYLARIYMEEEYFSENQILLLCVFQGYTDTIRCLLRAGVDVHANDVYGKTALDLAVYEGRVNCVLLLLQHEATLKIPKQQPYLSLYGLIYLKKSLPVDILRILRLYLL